VAGERCSTGVSHRCPRYRKEFDMFTTRGQNLILTLIVAATLIVLASLLLLRPEAVTVLAQGGGDKGNNEVMRNRGPGDVEVVPPTDGGGVGPQSDNSGVEVVPIAAFRHDGDNANGWFHSFAGGYIRNSSSDFVCFAAPTYPPDGASLTQFRFSLMDDSASSDLYVWLDRVHLATGSVETIAGGALTGRNNSIPTEVVDNTLTPGTEIVSKDYAYYVDFCFEPDTDVEILFYGARLLYTPATP
jgi:hypothetical protein